MENKKLVSGVSNAPAYRDEDYVTAKFNDENGLPCELSLFAISEETYERIMQDVQKAQKSVA
jgi:hypothetical protein